VGVKWFIFVSHSDIPSKVRGGKRVGLEERFMSCLIESAIADPLRRNIQKQMPVAS
jgi:hypothetical protein